jgi:hypothetical protein
MRMNETTEAPPDTSELPNFDGLKEWIERNAVPSVHGFQAVAQEPLEKWLAKLRRWCEEAIADGDRMEREREDLRDKVDALEQEVAETADYKSRLEDLLEQAEDVDRGIIDVEEFKQSLRRASV